ncbi:MAG: substrate-binding domain-containing protein [Anaerolineae bacterium]|jgi:DNA-binding LacI/PurR family transcriptional regulator|nr:substrate-binding domain-containing protein [Anaerolineae bacterium]
MSVLIGVITNNRYHVFQRSVIAGIEQEMQQHGYGVVVDSIAEDPQHPQGLILEPADMAGLIVIANVLPDADLQAFVAAGKPLTLVSHRLPGVPAVIPDNLEGMAGMVDYLVKTCQRRRLVFIEGDQTQHDGRERTRAFVQRLKWHDLPVSSVPLLRGDFSPAVAEASLQAFLASSPVFDAVAAADYVMAAAALPVLRGHGLRVPEAVSVVGFGDGSEAVSAGLTTIGVDVSAVGRRAARQLLGQMRGFSITGETLIGTTIVRRKTG